MAHDAEPAEPALVIADVYVTRAERLWLMWAVPSSRRRLLMVLAVIAVIGVTQIVGDPDLSGLVAVAFLAMVVVAPALPNPMSNIQTWRIWAEGRVTIDGTRGQFDGHLGRVGASIDRPEKGLILVVEHLPAFLPWRSVPPQAQPWLRSLVTHFDGVRQSGTQPALWTPMQWDDATTMPFRGAFRGLIRHWWVIALMSVIISSISAMLSGNRYSAVGIVFLVVIVPAVCVLLVVLLALPKWARSPNDNIASLHGGVLRIGGREGASQFAPEHVKTIRASLGGGVTIQLVGNDGAIAVPGAAFRDRAHRDAFLAAGRQLGIAT